MDKETIKRKIEAKVNRGYSDYYIGITNNRLRRKEEHERTPKWKTWDAESKENAEEIEGYFRDKGMNGHPGGGNSNTTYVYVYVGN